ncbi:MAG: hypothetical protein IT450_01895 [Phycisphaerales bacterium]|nr:hypothetical protein [Phycisphaerales bacterium]
MHMTHEPLPTLHRLRQNPIIRLFSSLWFGITLLTLITAYSAIVSAVAPVRFALEMTEMEAFRHWLFIVLVALLCISLTTATLTRIRFTIINAGVLTVHTGILLLCAGSLHYFGTKIEGSVRLDSPQIELVSVSGGSSRSVANVLAETGKTWSATMPAFGGDVKLDILDVRGTESAPASSARVRVQIGESASEIDLSAAERPIAAVNDKLAVRLVAFPSKRTFYDHEVAALHYGRRGDSSQRVTPIPGLPHYRERYLDEGYTLRDSAGRTVPTHRTRPELSLGGLKIPTGWFERWRLPIELDTPELPFSVTVTGFVSYVASLEQRPFPGGPGDPLNPVATLRLKSGDVDVAETLVALDPGRSLSNRWNLEFRWCSSPAEQAALTAPMTAMNELTIEVVDPPLRKTVAIEPGQTIDVEGTGYQLKVAEILPSWPLMSPGYENARSPVARVDVKRGDLTYNRTVVQRFPQFTQDIDAAGVRHRDAPVDANLKLTFRTCTQNWAILTAGPGLTPKLVLFAGNGQTFATDLALGEPRVIESGGGRLVATLEQLLPSAREEQLPVVEARERRRSEGLSAIRLRLTGRGPLSDWSESHWVLLDQFPEISPNPLTVATPSGETYELIYAPYVRPLGFELTPRRLTAEYFPGGIDPTSWQSDFLVHSDDGATEPGHVAVNQTATFGEWTLFQSGAATDGWSWTVLGVGNRHGIWTQVLGCCLITLGCLYAFYVKPVLKRRQLEAALARASAEKQTQRATRSPVASEARS